MSKNENVISLDERRRKAAGGARGGAGGGASKNIVPEQPPGGKSTDPGSSEPGPPVPGRLIWLHCPTCNTMEYTEMAMSGGRVHNTCGTQVQEAEVELDLRAEHTLSRINLERLGILENLLAEQRGKYEEYQHRLSLAAGKKLEEYPLTEEMLEKLPIAEVDAFGLLISRFFHQVEAHFSTGEKASAGETGAPASPPEDDPSSTKDD